MKPTIHPVKGTRDFYPEEMALRSFIYATARKVSEVPSDTRSGMLHFLSRSIYMPQNPVKNWSASSRSFSLTAAATLSL